MVQRQEYTKRKTSGLFFILLVLTAFMMLAICMRAAAEDTDSDQTGATYKVLPYSPIMNPDLTLVPPEPLNLSGLQYDDQTLTLTLSGATIPGTLLFFPVEDRTQGGDNVEGITFAAHYTIVLAPGTKSTVYALDLGNFVDVTIKGEGELLVAAPNKDMNYGAALAFNDKGNAPKLIIEGGTVTVDSTHHGVTLTEAGCLYIKEGAKAVTFIGRTEQDGTKLSVIPSKDRLQNNETVPRIFSDFPCLAQYVPYVNGGKEVVLSPNGTSSQSGDKTLSDASLLSDDDTNYYKLTFKPGYTATWQNDDVNQTVLEKDKVFYWPGQTPEYNGDTPTKARDAQYTYTFSGWSPTPAAIYKDTTYKAVYTTSVNKYTAAFNANGHGTAPASQTIEYGAVITKPADPTATGYDFGGWYKEAACTNAYDFSAKVTGDITLYAKWIKSQTQTQTQTQVVSKCADTPATTVTGMDDVVSAAITAEEQSKIASGEISVSVSLEVEKKSEKTAEGAEKIKKLVSSGKSVNMFLDLSLFKYVTTNATGSTTTDDLGSSNKVVLRVQVAYDTKRQGIEIIRYHNNKAQALNNLSAEPKSGYKDGTFFVGKGFVVIYASGFSTYAIADSGYKKEEKKTTKADTFIAINKVKHSDSKIRLAWEPVSGAQGYDIYAALCGRKIPSKPTMTVKGTKAVLKKAYAKTRNVRINADCIKYVIKAYKKVNGKKKYIAKSKISHTVGPNHNVL